MLIEMENPSQPRLHQFMIGLSAGTIGLSIGTILGTILLSLVQGK
jgi:ABC-type lipoprotein release transport system permease subunit